MIQKKWRTRWTFFRVKLIFEYDFEISWFFGPWHHGSLGHWDIGTLGHWDLGAIGPQNFQTSYFLQSPPHTFSYLLLSHTHTSPTLPYLLLSLPTSFWLGLVWYGMVFMVWFSKFISSTQKSFMVRWWLWWVALLSSSWPWP